jgi:hypothetical protein
MMATSRRCRSCVRAAALTRVHQTRLCPGPGDGIACAHTKSPRSDRCKACYLAHLDAKNQTKQLEMARRLSQIDGQLHEAWSIPNSNVQKLVRERDALAARMKILSTTR